MPPTADDLRISRVAALTLSNALIFHQVLAQIEPRVIPLERAIRDPNTSEKLGEAWSFVLAVRG